jgi:hypothetical protein
MKFVRNGWDEQKKKFDVKKMLIKFHQHFLAAFSQTGNMRGQCINHYIEYCITV